MKLRMEHLVAWMCETYEAKSVVGHKIGAKEWKIAAFDTLVQVAMQLHESTKENAETWIAEEVQEYYASKG